MSFERNQILIEASKTAVRNSPYPTESGKPIYPSELFGADVFSLDTLSKCLPKSVFQDFLKQKNGRRQLEKSTADSIAHAVRVWAMDKGATHFTHWFQPQTDSTAEKHDSFLSLKATFTPMGEQITPIDSFSGSQLVQAEPDASSFPSGGMRTTFEARGYTVWDTTSPMFIREGPNRTSVLYIPSVFISYNGEALDEKTVLLRSSEVLSKAACELLNLIDPSPFASEPYYNHVFTTLGTEQEFFLVDRSLHALRPDLKICGRTLVGRLPPRHQQLEDHYFGKMPSKVLAAISETELELYKLGVPLKTRHNEVAPGQFEVAPIFEEAMVAVDHNLLTMDVLHKVAHRHDLKVLFHEKPFKGVNGSGKHCNWSMSTDRGENLLDPTVKPETNYRFLLFLVAVLYAVHKHGSLLRAGISSSSNEHRLGANEAPPGIISVFLGEYLTEVLDSIEESREVRSFSKPQLKTIKLGGKALDVKVSSLPNISRDLTDRNRTSPFAFTGNKFEFRAVGSKQSPSFPVTLLNCAVASCVHDVTEDLRKAMGSKPQPSDEDILKVVKKYIKLSKSVRFEGDNYSDDWVKEAEKRGLPNIKDAPTAFNQLLSSVNKDMLTSLGIFSETELHSRYHILMEKYAKSIIVEAETLKDLINQHVSPSAFEYRKLLAETTLALKQTQLSAQAEINVLKKLGDLVEDMQEGLDVLNAATEQVHTIEEPQAKAYYASNQIVPIMEKLRENTDAIEELVADKFWTLPKYTELLLNL